MSIYWALRDFKRIAADKSTTKDDRQFCLSQIAILKRERDDKRSGKYIGVHELTHPCANRFRAVLWFRGRRYYLGVHETAVEAAIARDDKAWELSQGNGWRVRFNFKERYLTASKME